MEENEFLQVLSHLYEKTLILQDTTQFDKVTLFLPDRFPCPYRLHCRHLCLQYHVSKNIIGGEYLRWRIDEEKKGGPGEISPGLSTGSKESHPEKFAVLPSLWQMIYDTEDPASYRSFPDCS